MRIRRTGVQPWLCLDTEDTGQELRESIREENEGKESQTVGFMREVGGREVENVL